MTNSRDFGHRVCYSMFKISFAIFAPEPTTLLVPGIKVITKLDMAPIVPLATVCVMGGT